MQHTVYELVDATTQEVLYVGYSGRPEKRLIDHQRFTQQLMGFERKYLVLAAAGGFDNIVVTYDSFDTKAEALEQEHVRIRQLEPRGNVYGTAEANQKKRVSTFHSYSFS